MNVEVFAKTTLDELKKSGKSDEEISKIIDKAQILMFILVDNEIPFDDPDLVGIFELLTKVFRDINTMKETEGLPICQPTSFDFYVDLADG